MNYDPRWSGGYYQQGVGGEILRGEQLDSARLGASVEVNFGDILADQFFYPGTVNPFPEGLRLPRWGQALLEVDLTKTSQGFDSGSWVLTLDADTVFNAPSNPSTPSEFIVPAHIQVEIGTGGGRQIFDVDVRNQSFQLPASNVKVSVVLDEWIPPAQGGLGSGFTIPTKMTVRGALQRGVSAGRATRTLWTPYYNGGAPPGARWPYQKIPNFARCMRALGDRTSGWFTDGSVSLFTEVNNSSGYYGDAIMVYPGARFVNPAGLPVPAMAQSFLLDPGSPSAFRIYAFEFDIAL